MSERTCRILVNAAVELLSALLWYWLASSMFGLGRDASYLFGLLGLLSSEIKNRISDMRADLNSKAGVLR